MVVLGEGGGSYERGTPLGPRPLRRLGSSWVKGVRFWGVRVQGFGCDIGGFGFGDLGLGVWMWGLGFIVLDLGWRDEGLVCRVQSPGPLQAQSPRPLQAPRKTNTGWEVEDFRGEGLQGYLAHKKQPPPLGPP